MKEYLGGNTFWSAEEAHECPSMQKKEFFPQGIQALVKHWWTSSNAMKNYIIFSTKVAG